MNQKGTCVKEKKNISIFICGINRCRVVSTYYTIHRVNCISFSRQKGPTALVNMPLVFFLYTDRLHLIYIYILKTAQYKTAIQRVFEAVTRCKMHCQKNPWKFPHWGNIFLKKENHSLFSLRQYSSAPSLLLCSCRTPNFFSFLYPLPRAHSRRDVATSLRTRKRAFPWSGKNLQTEKRLSFSFLVTKTQKKNTRKQL